MQILLSGSEVCICPKTRPQLGCALFQMGEKSPSWCFRRTKAQEFFRQKRLKVSSVSRFLECHECTAHNDQSNIHFFPKFHEDSTSWFTAQGSSDNALKKSILFHFLRVPLELATHEDSIAVTCVA